MTSMDELMYDPSVLDDCEEAQSEVDADAERQPAAARRSRPFLGNYLASLPPDIKINIGDDAHEISQAGHDLLNVTWADEPQSITASVVYLREVAFPGAEHVCISLPEVKQDMMDSYEEELPKWKLQSGTIINLDDEVRRALCELCDADSAALPCDLSDTLDGARRRTTAHALTDCVRIMLKDEEDEEEEADLDEAELLRRANSRRGCIFALYEEEEAAAEAVEAEEEEAAEAAAAEAAGEEADEPHVAAEATMFTRVVVGGAAGVVIGVKECVVVAFDDRTWTSYSYEEFAVVAAPEACLDRMTAVAGVLFDRCAPSKPLLVSAFLLRATRVVQMQRARTLPNVAADGLTIGSCWSRIGGACTRCTSLPQLALRSCRRGCSRGWSLERA